MENNQQSDAELTTSSVLAMQKLVKHFGSQKHLAKKLGVHQGHISIWITRDKKPPLVRVKQIVKISEGLVTKYELRPDIFGNEPTIGNLLKQIISLFYKKCRKVLKINSKIITVFIAITGLGIGMYVASILLSSSNQQDTTNKECLTCNIDDSCLLY